MKIDRLFDKNYYKHKKHKYLKRESVGGYDLVKNPKTGKKTRRYKYKYTYPKTVTRKPSARLSDKRLNEYSEAISKLLSMQAVQLYQSRPYKHLLTSQEDRVLEIAESLGLYHPKSKFWFKFSNQKLLKELKIDRDV